MNRLGLIPCLGALLALPGCIVTYGLGETAEETSDGSGEGTAVGTDTGGSTDPDPSATSGQQPGTTDPSETATGQVPEPTDDGSATETDGEPADCERDPDYVRWQFNGESFSPLAGVDASFVALLHGLCFVGEITVAVPEVGDPTWSVPLECSLMGQIDSNTDYNSELSLVLDMTGTVDYGEVVSSFDEVVRLKLVLDWWGMGWNGWLVLEDLYTGVQRLDLVEAEYVDPYESTWPRQMFEVFGGAPWRNNLSVNVAADQCGGAIDKCGGEPRALAMGIGPDWYLQLHEGQEGTMSNEAVLQHYRASVTSARATPEPTCTDLPLASYSSAIWMQEQ